ncbi:MAG TPA: DUF885 domain-containing protein [Thermoplasmata archaeon]|nr:DUF885 domain-containing protein [Thermoplasmata archaeon]
MSPNSTDPAGGSSAAELAAVERAAVDHVFALQPGYAVFLGLHDYDGRLPDLRPAATERWVAETDRLLARLRSVPDAGGDRGRSFDRTLLELLLESPRFDLVDTRDYDRNPMNYLGSVSLTSYIVREYAPIDVRAGAILRILEEAPAFLDAGRRRLEPHLAEPFLQLALAIGSGLPAHFAEVTEYVRSHGGTNLPKLDAARAAAEQAVGEFLERLRTDFLPKANQEFALGAGRYQKLLWVREALRTSIAELRAAGLEDLRRNQRRFEEVARSQRPATSMHDLLEEVYRRHTTAEELIPSAQRLVAEMREFVRAKQLASIPEPDACRVEETPVWGRALSTASMNPPGPFEESGDEGIYFVTPVDPAWAPERREEWLRALNSAMLANITVHEVYPGHYLQFLHFRRAASTLARKVYLSGAFTEGWAHYCEQLAIEAGLRDRTAEAEAAQIHDALLRDCRLLVSVGLHTEGMTLEEGTQFFMREGALERLPAEREAIRGTFNPEYFSYTLGKLKILEARAKYLDPKFGGSLQRFHDRLMSFGSPPVGFLDELLGAH